MIKNFIDQHGIECYCDESLKRYNTYRLDVLCKYLVFPKNEIELQELIKMLRENQCRYIVLGNGSNVIFQDEYYDGVVVLLHKLKDVSILDEEVEVGSGYSLQKLALEVSSLGLEGLEFATGIPGCVGASIVMNAGAYKSSLSEVVQSVRVLNSSNEFVVIRKEDMDFSYRSSILKGNSDYVVVSAKLKLNRGNKDEILEKISKRRVRRLETQPLDMPSAGSVFRNPDGMYAGELIEKCGFKGYRIGGAEVSSKHANFIVNVGGATGRDIIQLIHKIQSKVKEEFGVDLILEQIIVK